MILNKYTAIYIVLIGAFVTGCAAGEDDTGLEYAPNMYHSVPYEPLSQIRDKRAGAWVNSTSKSGKGEYHNSNPYNPHGMTMRVPPANTVRRKQALPYHLPKDSLAYAAKVVMNPFPAEGPEAEAMLKDGKELYGRFCEHCHGTKAKGDGTLAQSGEDDIPVFAGIANLTSDNLKNISEGHIFHVITMGKGLMGSHASQISAEDRWKIIRYVKKLQK